MGFFDFVMRRDTVDNSVTTENVEQIGNDSTQEINNNENIDKEEEKVSKGKGKGKNSTKRQRQSSVTAQLEQKTVENNTSVENIKEKSEKSNNEVVSDSKEKYKEDNIVTGIKDIGEQLNKDINNAVDDILETMADNRTKTIKDIGEQLNKNINNAVDDILDTMAKETVTSIKDGVESQAKHIVKTTVKTINETAQNTSQKIQKNAENVIGSVNDAKRTISEIQDKLVSKVNAVGKRVTDMGESIEGIEGTLHRLNQLDTITELLQNKGLTMSMEIPPINADEEDIINLVRYSQKITEQLGYAARDLIRKQEAFKSQEKGNANEQKMMDQKIAKAYENGVFEGKKAFVKQLISKYEDIDTIRESENNHIHVIWTLLMELGVVIDGEGYYEKGKEIDFLDADIERFIGTYSKLDGAGKYKVVKTGLSFQGEIICKAEFEKINPDSNDDKIEEPIQENTEAQKENEEPESNENAEENAESGQNSNE